MRPSARQCLGALVVVSSQLFGPGIASAQPNDPDCNGDAARCGRQAFDAGVAAYKRSDWREALRQFRVAYRIRRHPIVVYNLALSEEKLGMFVRALDHVGEVRSGAEPELARKVAELRARLLQKVVTLTVALENERNVQLFVDDEVLPLASAHVDPGSHRVRVVADGRTRIDREISGAPGERLVLALDQSAPPRPTSPGHEAPAAGLAPVWCYAFAGATVLSASLATWSGLDTLKAKDAFERDLPQLSRSEEQQRLDDGHARERRTNVLFAVTGVLAVTTVSLGLFAVKWGPERKDTLGLAAVPGGAALGTSF